ncbi:MAG TPA: response regulator [Ignavibacteriaceae bacterium]|nr:response regulator [Ignavibacteriaceae bacterium]
MQISKLELLNKYNDLLQSALKSSQDFPDLICEFLVSEFDFEASILFQVNGDNFSVLGKSSKAKSSFKKNNSFECPSCNSKKNGFDAISFDSHTGCKLQPTDLNIPEGSLYLKSPVGDHLLKLAKSSSFSQGDKNNVLSIGSALNNLIGFWKGSRGNTSVSSIITGIAHDIRTPINSIMGFASLLSEDNLTSSQSEYVSTLKESAFSLLSLLNDLVDISKLDEKKSKDVFTDINIRSFIDDIINIFRNKIIKHELVFIINIDSNVNEIIKCDSQKLRYIFFNILTYSLRLTGKGKITLHISQPDSKKINFKISDTSAGLTTAKLKEIYSPSATIELGNSKIGQITGLSLTLVKRYIEHLNGNIDISSSGKGVTYNFTIGVESESAIEKQISALPKPGQKNNVLVVEDDYATSKLLNNYLNKWGYQPKIVNSGEQAIKAVESETFLAILMDIVLPDMNGLELLKTLREHKNTKNTPVIVCSIESEQQKAFLMGAVEYFVKPIRYNYLVEVLTSYRLKKDSNILIVDDDVPTLNLLKEAVLQLGFNPVAESHSSKVMDLIEDMHLDLAIVDLDMPELNGYDLIKFIKSSNKFSNLPIIIYTGKENYQDDLKKIDGLFEELLQKKSTNIEDLAETIKTMINRYDEPSTPEELITKKDVVKILLVEDYKHSQIIVTRLLKKNNFENIAVVENGAEAVDEVQKQKYDLILMDMQMPVMNGFEATEKIRQLPEYKDTPIIALTAFAMKGDREKCLEAGATDYIPKPIDSTEFIEKVKYYTVSKLKTA